MKSNRERGRWGTWLRSERLKRGLSPEQVRARLAERGFRVGESTYAEWESGYKKQPSKDAIPHLVALWGGEPPPEPERASTDLGDVVAAIRDLAAAQREQAAAMDRLLLELTEDRSERSGRVAGFSAVLGDFAGRLEQLLPARDGTPHLENHE